MSAGKLDRRIVLERSTPTQDASGQPLDVWAPLQEVWASRRDMSDGEKFADGQELNRRSTRFVVRSSPVTRGVTAKDRISYAGDAYEILGVKETPHGRHRFIEITATVDNADAGS